MMDNIYIYFFLKMATLASYFGLGQQKHRYSIQELIQEIYNSK